MPTVLRVGEFRLRPATLAFSVGLSPTALRTLRKLVVENEARLLEAWDGYFSR